VGAAPEAPRVTPGVSESETVPDAPLVPLSTRVKLDCDSYRTLCRKVLERDGWRCQQCGRATELQVHHIRFRSALGDDDLDNL